MQSRDSPRRWHVRRGNGCVTLPATGPWYNRLWLRDRGGFCFMEEAMSEQTSRQAARERIFKQIQAEVDRLLPADGNVPLQGRTFLDFENVAERVSNDLYVTIVEERVMLAGLEKPTVARCPHCSSPRLREVGEARPKEIRTPRGVATVEERSLRCRDCGRTFSPGAAGVVDADGGGSLAQGGREGGARGVDSVVR